jgi:peroxiredoxin
MRKIFLSLAALALMTAPAFAAGAKVGDKAPTFSGIPATLKGEQVSLSLSDIKEDVIVLVFLGNHCPVVQAYDDRVIDLTNAYKGKSVKVVGVCVNDMDEDRLPAIKEKAKEKNFNYVYGYDESGKIGHEYGAAHTPEFFILDKTRTIRYHGALDDNQTESKVKKTYVKDAVDALLAGKEVALPETAPRGCGIKYASK